MASGEAALVLAGGEVDVAARLALSGALHAGQIVLTGLAFALSQEQPICVCDAYDLGDYHVSPPGAVVRLTEVLPARLHGRAPAALRPAPGLTRQRKGFHDSPATSKPVCICFCKVPTPAVRRRASALRARALAAARPRCHAAAVACRR